MARYLFRRVVSWGRSSNVFLRNGSRLYLDVGSHPEYATAECDDLLTLIAHDKAGERILQDLVVDAEARLAEEGIGGDIYLFKNNTDSAGNSYGCHENFLIARAGEFSRIADGLIPFLVTRQLIAGAGKVLQSPRGASYCLSQRADHIWEGVSGATTRSRPIINTRDEPHADAERYRRLHVIVGDSNMCETTTLLKVGSAALVLEMIEAGVPLRDFTFENPIRAIREISHDISGRRPVRLAAGGEVSALDAQPTTTEGRRFRRLPRHRPDHPAGAGPVGADPEGRRVRDLSSVDTEIDWVIKKKLIDRYAERTALTSTPRIAQLDLTYHDVRPGRGLYSLLAAKGQASRVVTDDHIITAVTVPPQTTRARLRGEFVAAAQDAARDYTVDWVHLKLNDQAQRTVLLKDPFKATDERVTKLIESM